MRLCRNNWGPLYRHTYKCLTNVKKIPYYKLQYFTSKSSGVAITTALKEILCFGTLRENVYEMGCISKYSSLVGSIFALSNVLRHIPTDFSRDCMMNNH